MVQSIALFLVFGSRSDWAVFNTPMSTALGFLFQALAEPKNWMLWALLGYTLLFAVLSLWVGLKYLSKNRSGKAFWGWTLALVLGWAVSAPWLLHRTR